MSKKFLQKTYILSFTNLICLIFFFNQQSRSMLDDEEERKKIATLQSSVVITMEPCYVLSQGEKSKK